MSIPTAQAPGRIRWTRASAIEAFGVRYVHRGSWREPVLECLGGSVTAEEILDGGRAFPTETLAIQHVQAMARAEAEREIANCEAFLNARSFRLRLGFAQAAHVLRRREVGILATRSILEQKRREHRGILRNGTPVKVRRLPDPVRLPAVLQVGRPVHVVDTRTFPRSDLAILSKPILALSFVEAPRHPDYDYLVRYRLRDLDGLGFDRDDDAWDRLDGAPAGVEAFLSVDAATRFASGYADGILSRLGRPEATLHPVPRLAEPDDAPVPPIPAPSAPDAPVPAPAAAAPPAEAPPPPAASAPDPIPAPGLPATVDAAPVEAVADLRAEAREPRPRRKGIAGRLAGILGRRSRREPEADTETGTTGAQPPDELPASAADAVDPPGGATDAPPAPIAAKPQAVRPAAPRPTPSQPDPGGGPSLPDSAPAPTQAQAAQLDGPTPDYLPLATILDEMEAAVTDLAGAQARDARAASAGPDPRHPETSAFLARGGLVLSTSAGPGASSPALAMLALLLPGSSCAEDGPGTAPARHRPRPAPAERTGAEAEAEAA